MNGENLPNNMKFIDHGAYIEISRRWRGVQSFVLAAFTVLWWGVIAKFIADLPADLMQHMPFFHVLIGFALVHWTFASFFNRTQIFADPESLEIRHRPLPWFGNRKLAAANIEQIYVKKTTRRQRYARDIGYELRAKLRAGKDIRLLPGLKDAAQAAFIEEKLETALKIKDQMVAGETKGDA